ncbi:MAG: phosphatidate cytidylyltransferase [Firmicutes bacterium]|nr:phosphatidate cytidylyltransferase [Bacillota bacterium]
MKTRVLSGLAMAPLLILVALGGHFVTGFALVIALMGVREFFNGFKSMDIKPSYPIAVISIVIIFGIDVLRFNISPTKQFIWEIDWTTAYVFWAFLSVLLSLLYLFKINERKIEDGMATITGIMYVGFFAHHVVLTEWHLGRLPGASPVWLIFITAFGSDIFAYFGGYLFGKHKLCPAISPKKTVEGAISGVVCTIVLTVLFAHFFLKGDINVFLYVLVGLTGSIVSMFGDLTASIFKRKMGIKDYGTLIPGHGGVLDRVDSVLFTAPMVYYSMLFIHWIS